MIPNTPSDNKPTLTGAASPEELEAAQAANQADAQSALQAELDALKVKNVELADNYLRAKAEAENARRRADDEISKARKFAVESFAESLQ
jgi:molecular chaperone GrpE